MASVFAQQRSKLILAGALLVAAVVILLVQLRGEGPLPDEVTYVCVATGRTYNLDRDEVKWIPHENPDTGEETLLPGLKKEDGMYLDPYYRAALKRLGDANKCVDPETLKVRTAE
jgi:hypothetical protein